MKLNAPKQLTWWISVLLALLGLIATIVTIPFISTYAFWLVLIGFVLLAVATAVKNL